MGRMSREKGARAELEVGGIFEANGIDVFRTQNVGGKQMRGDLYGVPGHFLEIRRREAYRIGPWMDEIREEAKLAAGNLAPVLITRRSHEPWLAVQDLTDWIDLLKEAKGL
jgi:Holliday junction resolvase